MKYRNRDDVIRSLRKTIRECRDIIRSVESWNDNRTDAEPFDCETERVLLRLAEGCLSALLRHDGGEFFRLHNEMTAYGRSQMAQSSS